MLDSAPYSARWWPKKALQGVSRVCELAMIILNNASVVAVRHTDHHVPKPDVVFIAGDTAANPDEKAPCYGWEGPR
jgi:hypothetical protein